MSPDEFRLVLPNVGTDLLDGVLTAEERKVVDGPPVWEMDPPQREDYSSDLGYAHALRDYARRVMVAGVMAS